MVRVIYAGLCLSILAFEYATSSCVALIVFGW